VEIESKTPKSSLVANFVEQSRNQDKVNGPHITAILRDNQSRLLVLQDNIYISVALKFGAKTLENIFLSQSQSNQSGRDLY